jgi:hypothetical protein
MSIIVTDPLAFLTSQGGIVGTPLVKQSADGAPKLDEQQASAVIGGPIPIVFCRRVGGVGGVLISPAATEARFTNNAANDVTASYHLVLSEGQIGSIQVRDVFQRSCRIGSFTQTYNRRAGDFVAGNFMEQVVIAPVQFSFDLITSGTVTWYNATLISNVWRFFYQGTEYFLGSGAGDVKQVRNTGGGSTLNPPQAASFAGTGGTYAGLSTMAFTVTIPAGFDYWNRQVNCFIRNGIYVTRLLDSATGSSNNVADLLLYLLRQSSRVPEAQIDTVSLLAAATFTDVNGFWFNGVVSESTNLRDWIGDTLPYFLLRQTRIGGKEALKPLVVANGNGTIKTTAVSWAFTFTEKHVIPGSFEITYTPLADRKPFCATVLWRQQDDLGIPVMRATEVRYNGTALSGPYEQHDLSDFCSSEDHAVKVGAYILSKRRHVTHRLQLGVRPDAFNGTLSSGDLVRVRLERVPSTGSSSLHNYLYEVDRIGKSITGEVKLELTHFPVDADLASIVAKEVNVAVGSGILLPTGFAGVTCDINSSSDTSIPAEEFSFGPTFNTDFGFDELPESGLEDLGVNNPIDSIGNYSPLDLSYSGDPNNPQTGDSITAPSICPGGTVRFYRLDPSVPGGKVFLQESSSNYTYTMIINDVDYSVYSEVSCPDPSSPTGYSDPIAFSPTPIIQNGCQGIEGVAYNGTVPPPGNTVGAQIILANDGIVTREYYPSPNDCSAAIFPPFTFGAQSQTKQDVKGIELVEVAGTCGTKQLLWRVTYANNSVEDLNIINLGDNRGFASLSTSVTTTWSGPGAVPYCP